MKDIRIFMCSHKPFGYVPPLCTPIRCGAALGDAVEGALPDNEGDNISALNREYCELTAHYYAWKNVRAEYYGFCHYRRFFCADETLRRPYLAVGELSDSHKKLLGDEQQWRGLITDCDIIAPRSEDMGLSAREHYITSAYHYSEDLELFLEILSRRAPQLHDTACEYLSQPRQYFCNMFIMRAELFSEYCSILFPVLAEFDEKKTLHGDFQSDRTDGYLGELFTGMYISHCRKNGAVIRELPRMDVGCGMGKRVGCAVLPPESRRRFFLKRIAKKIRGKK